MLIKMSNIGVETLLTKLGTTDTRRTSSWFGSPYNINNPFGLNKMFASFAVFRIHDILVWIRIQIRGSKLLANGSGSAKVHSLHPFFKDKKSKRVTKQWKSRFFKTIFAC
jgi:hypothetical protein